MRGDVIFRGVPWSLVASSGFVEGAFETLAKEPQLMEEAAKLYIRFAAAASTSPAGAIIAAAAMILSSLYYEWVMKEPDDSIEKAMVQAAVQKLEELMQKEVMTNGGKNGLH